MRVHLAVFDRSRDWLIMKEDIYTSLLYWLGSLAEHVTMDCGRLDPQALNIICGLQYLSRGQVDGIADSGMDYGVFDVEYLSQGMVNFKPETAWLFQEPGRRFFERCRFFLSYFTESVDMLRALGVFSRRVVPGYCPALENGPQLPEAHKCTDVLFFGNVDAHRRALLDSLDGACRLEVLPPSDVTPLFLRKARAAQARLVLSLGRARPFTHIGPMRLVSMAHLRAFTLCEPPLHRQDELEPLCTFWEPGESPLEVVRRWLDSPDLRRARAEEAYEAMRRLDPYPALAAALEHRP